MKKMYLTKINPVYDIDGTEYRDVYSLTDAVLVNEADYNRLNSEYRADLINQLVTFGTPRDRAEQLTSKMTLAAVEFEVEV